MKTRFVLILLPFIALLPAFAQQAETSVKPNLKYGKPSMEELTMTTFAPDTTATAVYLFHQGESEFTYQDDFRLITEHWFRIKILKPQGASYADIAIPYYAPSDRDADKDNASNIDGCSYNMENGKCVKTPLKREFISNERINNRFKILKFSLPAVKAGTVIEYHYKLGSDYFAHIDNWMMQEELPILYNQYKACIPSNVFRKGFSVPPAGQRTSPICIDYGYSDIDTIRIHLPEGFTIEGLPKPMVLKTKFGRFHSTLHVENREILVVHQLYMYRETYAPEAYEAFVDFRRQVSRQYNGEIILKKE